MNNEYYFFNALINASIHYHSKILPNSFDYRPKIELVGNQIISFIEEEGSKNIIDKNTFFVTNFQKLIHLKNECIERIRHYIYSTIQGFGSEDELTALYNFTGAYDKLNEIIDFLLKENEYFNFLNDEVIEEIKFDPFEERIDLLEQRNLYFRKLLSYKPSNKLEDFLIKFETVGVFKVYDIEIPYTTADLYTAHSSFKSLNPDDTNFIYDPISTYSENTEELVESAYDFQMVLDDVNLALNEVNFNPKLKKDIENFIKKNKYNKKKTIEFLLDISLDTSSIITYIIPKLTAKFHKKSDIEMFNELNSYEHDLIQLKSMHKYPKYSVSKYSKSKHRILNFLLDEIKKIKGLLYVNPRDITPIITEKPRLYFRGTANEFADIFAPLVKERKLRIQEREDDFEFDPPKYESVEHILSNLFYVEMKKEGAGYVAVKTLGNSLKNKREEISKRRKY